MKDPTPKRLPSGSWRVQLRLGGKAQSITAPTKQEAIQQARMVKAEYQAGKLALPPKESAWTLSAAITAYCADRSNSLSPSTLLKYENIKNNHWPELMKKPLKDVTPRQWQQAVNAMLDTYAPKTVRVSYGMIKTVAKSCGVDVPDIRVGHKSAEKARKMDKILFLEPEQIPLFVASAATTPYAIPLLLALHGLRIAEIDGLEWDNLTETVVKIRQVRIKDSSGNWIMKAGAKNEYSVRDVKLIIPELIEAVKEAKAAGAKGKVMTCSQEGLRKACKRICEQSGIPPISIHNLRHTAASLSAYLGIPEVACQTIFGWSDDTMLREVYRHVAASELAHSEEKLQIFYQKSHEKSHDNDNP